MRLTTYNCFLISLIITFLFLLLGSCAGDQVDCETFPRSYSSKDEATLAGLNKYEFINSQFVQTTASISEFTSRTGLSEENLISSIVEEVTLFTLDNESSGTVTGSTTGSTGANIVRIQGNYINISTVANYTERIEEVENCNQLERCIYAAYFIGQNATFNDLYSHCDITNISDIITSIQQFQLPLANDVIFIARIEHTLAAQ